MGVAGIGLLLATVVASAPDGGQAERAEVLELAGEWTGTCTLRNPEVAAVRGAPRLEVRDHGGLMWVARAGDELSCSGSFEPLDREVGEEGAEGPVELVLLPARQVTVRGGGSGRVLVEWRRPQLRPVTHGLPDGSSSGLLARREVVGSGGGLDLSVAPQPRWLRLFRPDASPVTVDIDPDEKAPEIRLPEPAPGGEIFG